MYAHYKDDGYKNLSVEEVPDLVKAEAGKFLVTYLDDLRLSEEQLREVLNDAKNDRLCADLWDEMEEGDDEIGGGGIDPDYLEERNAPELSEMVFFNGLITPCPFCHSNEIDSYADGSAYCHHCHRWHRYA